MKFEVRVTKKDVKNHSLELFQDVVCQALYRAYPEISYASVYGREEYAMICVGHNGDGGYYKMSDEFKRIVFAFLNDESDELVGKTLLFVDDGSGYGTATIANQ